MARMAVVAILRLPAWDLVWPMLCLRGRMRWRRKKMTTTGEVGAYIMIHDTILPFDKFHNPHSREVGNRPYNPGAGLFVLFICIANPRFREKIECVTVKFS